MKAKKSLGQNFLIDNNIINKIIDSIDAKESDLIIEIGPGRGALTKRLKEKKSKLIAYEFDKDLKPRLDNMEDSNTKIIYQDILTSNINKDIKSINYKNLFIVGNLPYYITTPILENIINQNIDFNKLTIMVQKEVAERFMAQPGNKDYGYFTLFLKYYYNISKVCDVLPSSFSPQPKVNSMVIELTKRKNKPIIDDTNKYFKFLKDAFNQKRKTLKNNLKKYDLNIINKVLEKNNLNDTTRAEQLNEGVFVELYSLLVK